MDERLYKLLLDIQIAINEIDSFLVGKELKIEKYSGDLQLKRAIERDLEIIGEAVNKILAIDDNFPIQNARKIVGLRNQIIHGYDSISDEMIWSVIINHLPQLKEEINQLLQ